MSNLKLNSAGGGSVTLSVPSTASARTLTLPDLTDTVAVTNQLGLRNRIINGAMMIDQRNAGAAVTVSTTSIYCVDRFAGYRASPVNNFTLQQSSTAPSGFINSLVATMGTGVSPGTTGYAMMAQRIEGANIADFNLGTANASPFILSFWVRCSVAGTFGVAFRNGALTATYCATYTISSINTWEYKTISIPAITSGTWATDNTEGVGVFWDLGVGSTFSGTAGQLNTGANYFGVTGVTKLAATTGATFYITGVQLEKGATATPFENRLYGTELALCQRYYFYWGGTAYYARAGFGLTINTTTAEMEVVAFPAQMRSAPSLGYSAVSDWAVGLYNTGVVCTGLTISQSTPMSCSVVPTVASGLTANWPATLYANNTLNARLSFSAEL